MNKEEEKKEINKKKERAIKLVIADDPESSNHKASNVYLNFLDGTLVDVTFKTSNGEEATNHILFTAREEEPKLFRVFSEVCNEVTKYREGNWFFRLLMTVDTAGLIAMILILVFSLLLFVLAILGNNADSLIEIVKVSFTIILGYFFGSQVNKR